MGEHRECLIQSNVLSKWFNISLNWVSFYDQAEWVRYSLGIKCSSMWWKLTPSEHQGVNGKLFLLWYQNELNCQLITSQGVPNYRLQCLKMSWEESVHLPFSSPSCWILGVFPPASSSLLSPRLGQASDVCVERRTWIASGQTDWPAAPAGCLVNSTPACRADWALLLFQRTESFTVKTRVLASVFSGPLTAWSESWWSPSPPRGVV